MVDELTPQSPEQDPVENETGLPPVPQDAGFLSTTRGKAIAIVGALVVFLVIGGLAVAAFLAFFATETAEDTGTEITSTVGSTTTTTTAGEEGVSAEPGAVALSEVYTFRDIFDPLIETGGTDQQGGSGEQPGGDGDSFTPQVEADTLFLQDIVVRDGVTRAVLIWNGTTYELAQGEVISGTPWQVLSIGSESVTMLYGDEQVVLIIGQGITTPTQPIK